MVTTNIWNGRKPGKIHQHNPKMQFICSEIYCFLELVFTIHNKLHQNQWGQNICLSNVLIACKNRIFDWLSITAFGGKGRGFIQHYFIFSLFFLFWNPAGKKINYFLNIKKTFICCLMFCIGNKRRFSKYYRKFSPYLFLISQLNKKQNCQSQRLHNYYQGQQLQDE